MGKRRKQPKNYNIDLMEPGDLENLKKDVVEFIDRYRNIENELALLNEDRKMLIDEFSEKIDMKTLKQAMGVVKIEANVQHRDTFDLFLETLKEKTTV